MKLRRCSSKSLIAPAVMLSLIAPAVMLLHLCISHQQMDFGCSVQRGCQPSDPRTWVVSIAPVPTGTCLQEGLPPPPTCRRLSLQNPPIWETRIQPSLHQCRCRFHISWTNGGCHAKKNEVFASHCSQRTEWKGHCSSDTS